MARYEGDLLEIINTKPTSDIAVNKMSNQATAATRRSSQSSFSITIKIDSLEARRRLHNQWERGFDTIWAVGPLIAGADGDKRLRRALVGLDNAIQEAYRELDWGYVPERAFLADGVLAVQRAFGKLSSLCQDLKTACRDGHDSEGLALRVSEHVADIEEAINDIEEMRTQFLKELAGPQMEGRGKSWRRALARFFGRKRDTSQAKRVEEAHPYTGQARRQQMVDAQYYL